MCPKSHIEFLTLLTKTPTLSWASYQAVHLDQFLGLRYCGNASMPSFLAAFLTRSSRLNRVSPDIALRATSAEARWSASRVLIGSPGKGCRARSTTSGAIRSTCQCEP